jgi:hypothetical protein
MFNDLKGKHNMMKDKAILIGRVKSQFSVIYKIESFGDIQLGVVEVRRKVEKLQK